MIESRKILLLGSYGYTAQLIAATLSHSGISFSIAGRDPVKLDEMKNQFPLIESLHKVDIESKDLLKNLLPKFRIVVNCIGPYNVFGNLVLEECIDAGCCYIDICGEQHFVNQSFNNYQEKAVQTGACIFHSVAFESALVDLLAKVKLPENEAWECISSIYYFEKSRPSPGTRATMLTSQYFPVYSLEKGQLVQQSLAGFAKNVSDFGNLRLDAVLFAPYPEVMFLKRNFRVQNACSYLLTSNLEAKMATGRKQTEIPLETTMEENRKRMKKGPSDQERLNQVFEIRLLAESSAGKRYCFSLKGKDMYELTASIAEIFVRRLLSMKQWPAGIFTPSEIENPAGVFNEILKSNMLDCEECPDMSIF